MLYNYVPFVADCLIIFTFNISVLFFPPHSAKRCNCYMVCAGEATGLSQSRRSTGLEIGCLIDTATGLLTFTSSGVEMATFYQVGHSLFLSHISTGLMSAPSDLHTPSLTLKLGRG